MTGEQEQEIRWQQMASQGRLLADFSHEMRNHLAVIQEANGLLEDLLIMEEGKENPLLSSVWATAAQIKRRVQTSAELCRYLSRMAHRADTSLSSFLVNDVLEELVVFLERSARAQQVALQFDPGQEIKPIYNDPALLHSVLYQLYIFSLELLSNGQGLIISTAQAMDRVEVRFSLHGVLHVDFSRISETTLAAMDSLKVGLEEFNVSEGSLPEGFTFRLFVSSLSSAG